MTTDLHARAVRFAGFLQNLESPENRQSRTIMADLRTGIGRQPGESTRAWRHIVPYLAEDKTHSDQWFYLAGTLFPLHPHSLPREEKRRSLGGSFARIRNDLSKSGEARFLALLNADRADLPQLLRGAVSFLAANGDSAGIDWARLIRDLNEWTNPRRVVQERWAREFYRTDNTTIGDNSTEGEVEIL